MSKMSWISYLCESGKKKELIEEVGSEIVAQQFIDAHRIMRENRDSKAFDKLNMIADESIKEYKKNPEQVKEEGKNARAELNHLLNDVMRAN